MDRGAARSRKRTDKEQKDAERAAEAEASAALLAKLADTEEKAAAKGKGGKERPPRKEKKAFDPSDKSQYRAKAIRSSNALIYAQEQFALPPPAERLAGVTRVDLEGSGCADVSWLKDTAVTWLSLKGCPVTEGWDAVGGLEGLAVLNLSACGLSALPKELKALENLKAIVAMNNEWTELDADVVSGWDQLNSMIVSHSPNLISLPASLADLPYLAKITISHCAKLAAGGLPDLSPLPLLRDVRANNLPRLATLPSHIATWGTGDLALVGKAKADDAERKGDGLEVLDLGNCSLPLSAISQLFALALPPGAKPKHTWKLRSITLQANPLTLEAATYADLLQASPALPRLQIIDSKRVVERKNKGVVNESKADRKARERKEKKMGPTGANVSAGKSKMRSWGEDGETGEKRERSERADRPERTDKGRADRADNKDAQPDRKRKHAADDAPPQPQATKPFERRERTGRSERTERRERAERGKKTSEDRPKKPSEAPKTEDKPKKRKERYFEAADAADATAPGPAEAAPKVKAPTAPKAVPAPAPAAAEPAGPAPKKRKRKHAKGDAAPAAPAVAPKPAAAAPKPAPRASASASASASAPAKSGPAPARPPKKRSETAVVGVVEVAKARGVDLKSVLGGSASASGLDVGGW